MAFRVSLNRTILNAAYLQMVKAIPLMSWFRECVRLLAKPLSVTIPVYYDVLCHWLGVSYFENGGDNCGENKSVSLLTYNIWLHTYDSPLTFCVVD